MLAVGHVKIKSKTVVIEVVNRHWYKGSAEYIGRPSVLGNRFSHLTQSKGEVKVSTRDQAVDYYEEWLRRQINTNPVVTRELKRLYKLWQEQGHLTLSCWCAPARCHGDVLKKILEEKAYREHK